MWLCTISFSAVQYFFNILQLSVNQKEAHMCEFIVTNVQHTAVQCMS